MKIKRILLALFCIGPAIAQFCEDDCQMSFGGFSLDYTNDGECDDGGEGSSYDSCAIGKDCSDCGARPLQPPSPPPMAMSQCLAHYETGLIVGGMEVRAREYKFMITLKSNQGGIHFCGASIISPTWIMTAAHCTKPNSIDSFKVYAGVHRQDLVKTLDAVCVETRLPLRIIEHEEYDGITFANDIALVEIDEPFSYDTIAYLDNYQTPMAIEPTSTEQNLRTVVGWGKTAEGSGGSSNVPLKTSLPIWRSSLCQNVYDQIAKRLYGTSTTSSGARRFPIGAGSVCAGSIDFSSPMTGSCQGDSGGPLFVRSEGYNFVQVGIVSWGMGCATKGIPTVYTRVAEYREWVCTHTNAVSACYEVLPPSSSSLPTTSFPTRLATSASPTGTFAALQQSINGNAREHDTSVRTPPSE